MKHARLRDVAAVNPAVPEFDVLDGGALVTFMPLETVWPDARVDVSRVRPKLEVASGYVRFREGDILCPKVTPTFQAGRSALVAQLANGVGAASTEVHVVRATPGLADGRFLRYRLMAKDFLDEGVANFQGVAGLQRVPEDFLKSLRLPTLALEEQRRIADYLDDQMSCLDKLMGLCQREIQQVAKLEEALLESAFGEYGCTLPGDLTSPIQQLPDAWRVGELGHLLRQLTNGFVGPTREILTEDGVPYIQSLHIKGGRIDFERRPYYVAPEWHHSRPRIHLQTGDVVIVQTGDIGQTAVVPPGFGEASCHALQIARVLPTVLDPNYLGEYLRTRYGRNQLLSRATGALHPHLEAGIKSVPVVVPPIPVQQSLVEKCSQEREGLDELRGHIARREQLALEYRQSLITAAVTGELDVTTARRGIPA